MNGQPYIPKATAAKLEEKTPKGYRHETALKIAVSMIGEGWAEGRVFSELRAKFEPDVTDNEIAGVIAAAKKLNPQPTGKNGRNGNAPVWTQAAPVAKTRTPMEQAEWWSKGTQLTVQQTINRSPVSIPSVPSEYGALVLSSLFREDENLNLVCQFFIEDGKAKPQGAGRIWPRNQWIDFFVNKGVPSSNAGGWIRINPTKPNGSGKEGAVTNEDITAFHYLLVESDVLPLGKQLALYARFKLPIAAIIMSGGASAHAWVRLECPDIETYHTMAVKILELLKPFGFDTSNKNPSRLCRIPGSIRKIGAVGDGEQKLIYLNPDVAPATTESLVKFEQSLTCPCVESLPLMAIAKEAQERYEWMKENAGKLGVPTGIEDLDQISGGMKGGQTIVVAGQSGGGKTTLALHLIVSALAADYSVALFSLEMSAEEIFDLLVSRFSDVDRNKFNHGRFTSQDMEIIGETVGKLAGVKLYIEDSAMTSAEQIKQRVFQLKADANIGLVVVDYIQFVNPEWSKETREQQVSAISHQLRALARESKIPMVVLSQLNDEGRLRESRVIAHNANVVMMVGVEGDKMTVDITKGRGIPTGKYELTFDRQHAKLISAPSFPEVKMRENGYRPYTD